MILIFYHNDIPIFSTTTTDLIRRLRITQMLGNFRPKPGDEIYTIASPESQKQRKKTTEVSDYVKMPAD